MAATMTDADNHLPIVSLRVPGVDSTADAVLDVRVARQLDDVVTRGEFWRRRPERSPGYTVEAYLWNVRSKPHGRALWMLLLPFTLINIAYWARPARRGVVTWAADSLIGILCRLVGLTLTATLMLSSIGITMDLLAWQCLGPPDRAGGVAPCGSTWPAPLDQIRAIGMPLGLRLVVASALPLGLLWTMWLASLRTWRRYEARIDIPLRRPTSHAHARFWRGRPWVERLRATHVLVGLALITAALVYPLLRQDLHLRRVGLASTGVILLVLAAAMIAAAVVGAVAPLPLDSPTIKLDHSPLAAAAGHRRWPVSASIRVYCWLADRFDNVVESSRTHLRAAASPVTSAVRGAAFGAAGTTVAALVYAAIPRQLDPSIDVRRGLPGFAGTVASLAVVQTLLLVALSIVVLPLCWTARRSPRPVALRGFVAPLLATAAVLLAVGEAASALYVSALLIGQSQPPATGLFWQPAPPYPYEWAGLILALSVGLALLAGAWHALRWRRLLATGCRITDGQAPTLRRDRPQVAETLDRAHARARVLEHVPHLVLIVMLPMAALSLVGVVYGARGRGPGALIPSHQAMTYLGSWSIGLLGLVVTVLGLRAIHMTPVRRLINAVWAMGTIWPRTAHPFGAPAHGPRSVADLVWRITRLTRAGHSVLLAGHSHGAALATLTVLYLPDDAAQRTALLTSASPLPRLMQPYFAGFVNDDTLQEVAERLTDDRQTRWRNLYRATDPLGGPVFGARPADQSAARAVRRQVDRLAPDPHPNALQADIDATPRGHGDYLRDPTFIVEHATLVDLLTTRSRPRRSDRSEPCTSPACPGGLLH